jgi:hypothetical protein
MLLQSQWILTKERNNMLLFWRSYFQSNPLTRVIESYPVVATSLQHSWDRIPGISNESRAQCSECRSQEENASFLEQTVLRFFSIMNVRQNNRTPNEQKMYAGFQLLCQSYIHQTSKIRLCSYCSDSSKWTFYMKLVVAEIALVLLRPCNIQTAVFNGFESAKEEFNKWYMPLLCASLSFWLGKKLKMMWIKTMAIVRSSMSPYPAMRHIVDTLYSEVMEHQRRSIDDQAILDQLELDMDLDKRRAHHILNSRQSDMPVGKVATIKHHFLWLLAFSILFGFFAGNAFAFIFGSKLVALW